MEDKVAEDKVAEDKMVEDKAAPGRKRSRRRTASRDRRQSLLFEDTMATYLLIQLVKVRKICVLVSGKNINKIGV